MAIKTEEYSEPLSDVFAGALDADQDGEVSIQEILDRVADRGFGLLLFLFALPNLVPIMPPGSSGVFGAILMSIGLQMVFCKSRPWLPTRFRHYRLSPKIQGALQSKGVNLLKRMERFSRPRFSGLDTLLTRAIVGAIVMLLGLVLFSPLPFMNTLPAILIVLMAVGLMNRDGLLIGTGALLGVALLTALTFGFHWFVELGQMVKARLLGG